MTVEQLTAEIIPRGRGALRSNTLTRVAHTHTHTHTLHQAHLLLSPLASAGTVPDEIKSELLQKIRRFAEAQS